jgi:2'-5' RNA ligase
VEQVRSFVAVELPEDAQDRLAIIQQQLRHGAEQGVKWVDPRGVHLTLKFLGNVPAAKLPEIEQALRVSVPAYLPLRLGLGEVGAFPSVRSPRVIWVGLRGEIDRLAALQDAVERALEPLGFPREGRAFAPHLTLGRAREGISLEERRRVSESIGNVSRVGDLSFEVVSIVVMRSQLTRKGAIYSPITTISR